MPLADFVIDAHDGQIVEVLPRACAVTAFDAMNRQRDFQTNFDPVTAVQQLQDATLNLHTDQRQLEFPVALTHHLCYLAGVVASYKLLLGALLRAEGSEWGDR
ncbi:MAG: hypothetical protein M3410_08220 [Acidobacteriota bacterium]|nr:hypothetical protein [Acidobacteriota bacterium]